MTLSGWPRLCLGKLNKGFGLHKYKAGFALARQIQHSLPLQGSISYPADTHPPHSNERRPRRLPRYFRLGQTEIRQILQRRMLQKLFRLAAMISHRRIGQKLEYGVALQGHG